MRTKTTDRRGDVAPTTSPVSIPSFPETVAYWLEDDVGNRVSRFFSSSEMPMKLAGRACENLGTLRGWTVARRGLDGARHVVASGTGLEALARPFMPVRAPDEAAAVRRVNEARRRDPTFPSRAQVDTDERVY
jgi:hypothetical protein